MTEPVVRTIHTNVKRIHALSSERLPRRRPRETTRSHQNHRMSCLDHLLRHWLPRSQMPHRQVHCHLLAPVLCPPLASPPRTLGTALTRQARAKRARNEQDSGPGWTDVRRDGTAASATAGILYTAKTVERRQLVNSDNFE